MVEGCGLRVKLKRIKKVDKQRQLSFVARVLFFPFYFVLRHYSLLRFDSGVVLWKLTKYIKLNMRFGN